MTRPTQLPGPTVVVSAAMANDTGSNSAGSSAMGSPDRRDDTSDDPSNLAHRSAAGQITQDRAAVVARERAEHGGIKIGSAFFGWLTATGMMVLLVAIAVAAGTAVGVATDTQVDKAADAVTKQADTVGIVGGIIVLAILFVAYYCGGYVAGRMARFDGLKQGLAVWLWAIVIAIVVAILGVVAGAEYNVLDKLNSFPRIPVGEGELTTGGLIALGAALVMALVGALLGGLAGMRFHRSVDQTGLGK